MMSAMIFCCDGNDYTSYLIELIISDGLTYSVKRYLIVFVCVVTVIFDA